MTGWLSLLSLVCLLTTLSVMECQSTLRYAHREAAAGLTDIPWQIFCSQADQGYLCALAHFIKGQRRTSLASFYTVIMLPILPYTSGYAYSQKWDNQWAYPLALLHYVPGQVSYHRIFPVVFHWYKSPCIFRWRS